jgi:hypothetical protein
MKLTWPSGNTAEVLPSALASLAGLIASSSAIISEATSGDSIRLLVAFRRGGWPRRRANDVNREARVWGKLFMVVSY